MMCGCTKPPKIPATPPTVFNVDGDESTSKAKIGVQAKIQIVGNSRTINVNTGQAVRIGQNWIDQLVIDEAPIWIIG